MGPVGPVTLPVAQRMPHSHRGKLGFLPGLWAPVSTPDGARATTLSLLSAKGCLCWAFGCFPVRGLRPWRGSWFLADICCQGQGVSSLKYLDLPQKGTGQILRSPLTLPSPAQESLMLSILPKHVADEMLKDLKKDESQKDQQQFNTMYMYRHENVRCTGLGRGLPARDGVGLWGPAGHCGFEGLPLGLEARPSPQCEPYCRADLLRGVGLRHA